MRPKKHGQRQARSTEAPLREGDGKALYSVGLTAVLRNYNSRIRRQPGGRNPTEPTLNTSVSGVAV